MPDTPVTSTVSVLALALYMSTPGQGLCSHLSSCCPVQSRPGTGTEPLLNQETCSRRSWAGALADLGPRAGAWASAAQCQRPSAPTWTGSSTLLLRKLRELARFILRVKDDRDLPMVGLVWEESGWGWEGGGRAHLVAVVPERDGEVTSGQQDAFGS